MVRGSSLDKNALQVGEMIRAKRLGLNLSQKQAGNLFTPSIDQSVWSSYERGAGRAPERVIAWLEEEPEPHRPRKTTPVRDEKIDSPPLWRWFSHLSQDREPTTVETLHGASGVEIVWRETRHLSFRVVLSHPVLRLGLNDAPKNVVVSTLHKGRTKVSVLAHFNSVLDTLEEQRRDAKTNKLDIDHISAERVLAAVMAWCAIEQCRRLKA